MVKRRSKKKLGSGEGFYDIPFLSIRDWVKKAYPDEYLHTTCDKIGIKDAEKRKEFCDGIRYLGRRYIELKRANPASIRPSTQKRLLNQYKNALSEVQLKYKGLFGFVPIRTKIEKALRKKYDGTTDPTIKGLLSPYCDSSGMSIELFGHFFSALIELAEDAKHQKIGKDKADYSSEYLMGWIAAIRKFWPEDATIKFALGKRDKELKMYSSRTISILHSILCKVETDIDEKRIENSLRKISKKDNLDQWVALFFLG